MTAFPILNGWSNWNGLASLQREELPRVLERARRSSFYRERLNGVDGGGALQWNDVPFTTKTDLRSAYPFGLLAVPRAEVATYHESSGTSGEPTASFLTEADWAEVADRFGRNAAAVGRTDTVMVKTPYALVTTAHQMHVTARARGAMVVPADNRSTMMPYSRVIRLLRDLDVTVSWSMPFEALLWAEAARLAGHDPRTDFPQYRALMVAGEPLSGARQRAIEAVWGRPVFQDYGSTETCSLAGQCSAGKLHLWADRVYPEVLDQEMVAHPEGTGELVVTTLFARAMPLVRYRVGDLVSLSREPCRCGWILPTIQIRGRRQDQVEVQGRRFLPSDLEDVIYHASDYLVLFWRARHSEHSLSIELEARSEGTGATVREAVKRALAVSADVRVLPPGTIIPQAVLTEPTRFTKPRFMFRNDEPWPMSGLY